MEFSSEELALIEQLGITIPKPPAVKFIKSNIICRLCKTTTTQYFRMIEQEKGTWVKDCKVDPAQVEISKAVEVLNLNLSTCKMCKETLMKKEKAELVAILMHAAQSFPVSKDDILPKRRWKKKLRKGKVE